MRNTGPPRAFVALALVLGVLAVAPAAAFGGKPDLVVAPLAVPRDGVFRGTEATLLWRDRTRNIGTARAESSQTGLQYFSGRKWSAPVALRRVGRLARRAANEGTKGWTSSFPPAKFRFGSYPLRICADIKRVIPERKEGNNCRRAGAFYVIPQFFWVSVDGSVELFPGPVNLLWTTDDGPLPIMFSFSQNRAPGVFEWKPASPNGRLTYTVKGTDAGGCVWSGGTSTDSVNGPGTGLILDFVRRRYTAQGLFATEVNIPATQVCPEGTAHHQVAILTFYLATGMEAWQLPKRFGLSANLTGGVVIPPPGLATSWLWQITPGA
jgi:hypothetical protein